MNDPQVERTWRCKIESVVIAVLVLAFLTSLIAMVVYAGAQPVATTSIRVIDGDTIALKGQRQHIRLVGFNAPETGRAECLEERQLGERAKRRLIALITSGQPDLTLIACSCEPGTEGTQWCNHGRSCGILTVDRRDVGAVLIGEGLAVPFKCGRTSCPPTPRPWCGG